MKVWAIANQKGGVGKTTSTVTLAGILASRNENTLMIDLDPHASLSSYFGFDPENTNNGIYELFIESSSGKQINIDRVVRDTGVNNLSLIPATPALATLEKKLGSRNGMGLMLSQILDSLSKQYDNVLIDCPPVLGMLIVNALVACDHIVIPVQTEHLAIKGLKQMLRTLDMIESSLQKKLSYTILPTMYDQRTRASQISLQLLSDEHTKHISDVHIPVDTKFRDASLVGKPISSLYPNTHGLKAYENALLNMKVNNSHDVKEAAL